MSSSDHEQASMEQDGVGRGEQVPTPAALSTKKLWRMVRALHLVLVRGLGKHQPKLAALGVNLHHMLSTSKRHHHLREAAEHSPALTTYLSAALSCRSMDPGAVVHPYPRRSTHGSGASLSSLSCRSMDPGAAVYQQYQYRPREVEFSCSSTPLYRRRRRAQRHRDQGLILQQKELGDHPEHGSAVAVKKLFELMDVDEEDDGDVQSAVTWATSAASGGRPAPRQVRITDSPFLAREEEDEGSKGVVDQRADEFILWFHDQLRMQQQQRPAGRDRATYWVR